MDTEALIDAVRDYLDGEGYHYEYDAEKEMLKLGFNLKCKLKSARIIVDFKKYGYLVYAVSPINGDKDNLGELLRYTAQANYGLLNGNFEVDVRDGEVRYKCWVPGEDIKELPKVVIEDSIMMTLSMMNKYGDGIAALAMGFSDAQTEIDKAEGDGE